MSKFRLWMMPTLAMVILAIFVIGTVLFYDQVQRELRTKESSILAEAIGSNLLNEIKNVTQVLNSLSQIETVNAQNKTQLYSRISRNLIERYPGFFYGINFINPEGKIEKIYPVERNHSALGRNLMERPELKPYLQESLRSRATVMSHRILTYQGIYAVIIYEPLFDQNQEFKGWLNAVVNIDAWLKQQLRAEGWQDTYLHLRWPGHEAHDLNIGKNKSERLFFYDFRILNQNIKMSVGLPQSSLKSLHRRLLYTLEFLGFMMLGLVSFLLYKLTVSRRNLILANQQLSLKTILLNTLAHDVSSPLTSLSLIIEQVSLQKNSPLSETQKARAAKSLSILNEMLTSVRSLSRLEMERFKTQPVSLWKAVTEATSRVQESAERKKVFFKIENNQEELFVQADERTLINNVIPNVLSNAIKFTKPDTNIYLQAERRDGCIWLNVVDEGNGFSEDEIKSFNQNRSVKSSLGTQGEIGSGLGLIQVKGFMTLYGGRAFLDNSEKGARVRLRFAPADSPRDH